MICPQCHIGMDAYGEVVYNCKSSNNLGQSAFLYTCSSCDYIEIVEIENRGCDGKILYCGSKRNITSGEEEATHLHSMKSFYKPLLKIVERLHFH